ncbi:MAG: methionine synthase [Nitrospirae bacterium]|nr:methionine synthase [Nitrospirota bacterium]
MEIKPFSTTGIGSLPHTDPLKAVRVVLETFDIPFWPQMTRLSFKEGMIAQYSEGMPFIKVDSEQGSIWIDKDNPQGLERFYETYTDETLISISEDYAKGLYAFLNLIRERQFEFLKCHVTGPLTFTLGLKDKTGVPVYYDEELREISLMLLKAKIRWQIETFKVNAKGVIMFIDEPILSALGSTAYIGVKEDEALRLLKETSDAIWKAGGIPGIHCCGRADWPLVTKAGVRILNFDAYGYADTLMIYPEEIRSFMEQGGILAWGIVPTTEAIRRETDTSIRRRFLEALDRFSKHIPIESLRKNIILTPSCGTGSLSIPEALKVFQLLARLKEDVS